MDIEGICCKLELLGFFTFVDGQGVLMNFVACIIVIYSLTTWQIEM
jgi:hypothetical protein